MIFIDKKSLAGGLVVGIIIGLWGGMLFFLAFKPNNNPVALKVEDKNGDIKTSANATNKNCEANNVAANPAQTASSPASLNQYIDRYCDYEGEFSADGITYFYQRPRVIDVFAGPPDKSPTHIISNIYIYPNSELPIFSTTTKKNIVVLTNEGGDMGFISKEKYYIDNVLYDYVGVLEQTILSRFKALKIRNGSQELSTIEYNIIGECKNKTRGKPCSGQVTIDGLTLNGEKIFNFDKPITENCVDAFFDELCAPDNKNLNVLGIDEKREKVNFSIDYLKGKLFFFDISSKSIEETEKPASLIRW